MYMVWCVEQYARGFTDDNIEGVYSGVCHETREEAEIELQEANEKIKGGRD